MKKKVIIPIPSNDFDPTETAVPWKILSNNGVEVVFSTPKGLPGWCDPLMLNGKGLGILAPVLQADRNGRQAYKEMSEAKEFLNPIEWSDIDTDQYDGLILPGGHAKGMRVYLESQVLQNVVSRFFLSEKPVGAICHGVVLAARSKRDDGISVLHGKKTTALLASQELMAWGLTCLWLQDYYRTYPMTVESEVRSALASNADFIKGPLALSRDEPDRLDTGFCVRDGNYLSSRWPGDAHKFGNEFLKLLK